MNEEQNLCPSCGAPVGGGLSFCPECGTGLTTPSGKKPSRSRKKSAATVPAPAAASSAPEKETSPAAPGNELPLSSPITEAETDSASETGAGPVSVQSPVQPDSENAQIPVQPRTVEAKTATDPTEPAASSAEQTEEHGSAEQPDATDPAEAPAATETLVSLSAPEADPTGDEASSVIDSVIPAPETKGMSKREARLKAKAEREVEKARRTAEAQSKKLQEKAEKLQRRAEEKAAKQAAGRERRLARKKKNIWAIVLSVILLAALCYAGKLIYELTLYNDDTAARLSQAESSNEGLNAEIKGLQSRLEAQQSAADELESGKEQVEKELSELQNKLNDTQTELKEAQKELETTAERLEKQTAENSDLTKELADFKETYNGILAALEYDNIGGSSENLTADTGVVIMKKTSRGYDVKISCRGQFSVACVSGDSASCEITDGYTLTFKPEKYGVCVYEVGLGRNKSESLHIVVIVE